MNIIILSYADTEEAILSTTHLINDSNTYVISIYSAEDHSPVRRTDNKVIRLQFDDVTYKDADTKEKYPGEEMCIFFNEQMAKELAAFVRDIQPPYGGNIIVHCDAGVSRSGAVGTVLNNYFNLKYGDTDDGDYEEFISRYKVKLFPNPLVVKLLEAELECSAEDLMDSEA